jgi:endonuclease III
MIIDSKKITDFNRNRKELETFWIFSMFVAGKNADYANKCLSILLKDIEYPFDYLKALGESGIENALREIKIGQYTRLVKAIWQSLDIDLTNCTLNDLTNIHGVGPKTARFFLLHSRKDCDCAVLDTHILAWMKDNGVEDAPKVTPQNQKLYLKLEEQFIKLAHKIFPTQSIAEIDLFLWTKQSGRLNA